MSDAPDLTLRDGTPFARDFGVARQFTSPDRVLAIREAIRATADRETVSRTDLDAYLTTPLTAREAASLFTCLQKNGVATQAEASPSGYADYHFSVAVEDAAGVLDQQAVVVAWADAHVDAPSQRQASFVATLPSGFTPRSARVRALPAIQQTIRSKLFDARETVRIANPYFDPSLELVDDLASLPRRGIQTKVLTRETSDARDDLREALNRMWDQVERTPDADLEVRDLYEWNADAGVQAYATHAKMVVVDEEFCYVGSANLTDTSLSRNFEFGVVVEGDDVADAVLAFDEVFEYARRVDLPL